MEYMPRCTRQFNDQNIDKRRYIKIHCLHNGNGFLYNDIAKILTFDRLAKYIKPFPFVIFAHSEHLP